MAQRWGRVANVMPSPWRHPKTGIFWFRQAVPKALQAAVAETLGRPAGTRHLELKWTIGTKDAAEAKRQWPAALLKAQGIFAAALSGAKPLSHEQVHALAGVWYEQQLQRWVFDPSERAAWEGWAETIDTQDGPVALNEAYAADLLISQGVVTDPDSKLRLSELLAQRLVRALMRQDQLDSGDFSRDPLPATFPVWVPPAATAAAPQVAVSLSRLVSRWNTVAVVKPRTVEETAYAVGALIAFLGHDDAMRLVKADLVRWRDEMKKDGRSNATWNNRLSLVRQVLLFGVSEGALSTDPAEGLRLAKGKTNSPLPYTDAEAVRILLAARGEVRPSLRWAHWIMAFTGMRAGEVLQLSGGDVREDSGVRYLAVHEDDASKSVKTGERRNVPIHAALVAEGFLAFTAKVKADAPLFPDKRVDRHGNRGGRAWQVTGRWVREVVGVTDPQKAPDHSWRHRVEDELRAAGVPEDARDALLGHARKTTGRLYGVRGESLKRLAEAVERIPVPEGLKQPSRSGNGLNTTE